MKNKPSVVITGAAGGIGRALVNSFHQAGYFVIGTDIEEGHHKSVANCFIQADLLKIVEDESYATKFFKNIQLCLPEGKLSALINNAAIQVLAPSETLTRNNWHQSLNINLLAPFFLTQGLLPSFEKTQASVVNISSIHANLSKKNFVVYATTKAALSAMTRNMAVDLGSKVRINAIEPAAVSTAMLVDGLAATPQALDSLAAYHPLERIASPEEIAAIALFLCSEKAAFIHACVLPVDGGLSSRLHDPE